MFKNCNNDKYVRVADIYMKQSCIQLNGTDMDYYTGIWCQGKEPGNLWERVRNYIPSSQGQRFST